MSEPRRLQENVLPADVLVQEQANQPGGFAAIGEDGTVDPLVLPPIADPPVVDPTSATLPLDLFDALVELGLIRGPGS